MVISVTLTVNLNHTDSSSCQVSASFGQVTDKSKTTFLLKACLSVYLLWSPTTCRSNAIWTLLHFIFGCFPVTLKSLHYNMQQAFTILSQSVKGVSFFTHSVVALCDCYDITFIIIVFLYAYIYLFMCRQTLFSKVAQDQNVKTKSTILFARLQDQKGVNNP